MLLEGPAGWGEFCPFPEYDDAECVPWLAAAVEAAQVGWPAPVRDRVPVNAIVPAVSPSDAYDLVKAAGCGTAKVRWPKSPGRPGAASRGGGGGRRYGEVEGADTPGSLGVDVERVAAVRDALGPDGAVRVDANAAWDVDEA